MKKIIILSLSLLSTLSSAETPTQSELHERLMLAQERLVECNDTTSQHHAWLQGYVWGLTYAIYGDL